MKTRSIAAIAVCVVVVSAALAGCGPTDTTTSGGPTPGATPTAPGAAPTPTASAAGAPAVKDLTPGNCTLYPKAAAIKLLGGVNMNNKALNIGTDGGKRIDVCSYLDLKGGTDIQGASYAVVRYDSPAVAFAEAKKARVDMLGSAAEHNWSVQSLTTPAPGTGPVLGGSGTKTDQGVTYSIAVVGTNVGPYLVAALGASTGSTDTAKAFALKVFEALATVVG